VTLHVAGDADNVVVLAGLGEDDAHGVAALGRDLVDQGAHDLSTAHDDEHLVGLLDEECAHEVAALLLKLGHLDAQAAAALDTVLVH